MSSQEMKKELERLRMQVEEMSSRVDGAPKKSTPAAQEEPDERDLLERARVIAEELHLPGIAEHVGSYLKTLGGDVRDSKPNALVASFVAGVLVGKMMSK